MALGQLIELATGRLTAGTAGASNINHLRALDGVRLSAMRGGYLAEGSECSPFVLHPGTASLRSQRPIGHPLPSRPASV